MTSHHSDLDRRAEQFEDLFKLMKADGLKLEVEDNGHTWALVLVEPSTDYYVHIAYIDKDLT